MGKGKTQEVRWLALYPGDGGIDYTDDLDEALPFDRPLREAQELSARHGEVVGTFGLKERIQPGYAGPPHRPLEALAARATQRVILGPDT